MPRIIELMIVSIALVILSPLFLILMLAIVIDSPGWPFFIQQRVGINGKYFNMFKFRKMPRFIPKDGKGITTAHDVRLTRMGRLLERFKMDELPQLFNVLNGTMSLVGPRPELPKFTVLYPEKWEKVLSVKPGIVGYSQIKVPHETDLYPPDCLDHEEYYLKHILPEKLDNEIEYVQQKSLVLDLNILFNVTFSLLTRTITLRWLLVRYWHFHMLISDTILSCICLYGSYLLIHQGGIPPEIMPQLSTAMWNNLWIRPVIFLMFTLHRYPFSSSLAMGYIFRIVKASIVSSVLLIITLMLFYGERDLILSAHIVDLLLLPSFLIGARLFYISLHDSLIQAGFFYSVKRAILHVFTAVCYGFLGVFSYWFAHFIRLSDNFTLREPEIFFLVAFFGRAALSILLWPPRVKSRSDLVKHEYVRIIINSLTGTGLILSAHLMFGIENFSRLALIYDFIIYTLLTICISTFWSLQKLQKAWEQPRTQVLIYGVGVETELFLSTLERMPQIDCNIIGIVSDIDWKRFSTISGIHVLGTVSDLPAIVEMYKPTVLLTWERVTQTELFPKVEQVCKKYNLVLSVSPSIHSLVSTLPENNLFTAGSDLEKQTR